MECNEIKKELNSASKNLKLLSKKFKENSRQKKVIYAIFCRSFSNDKMSLDKFPIKTYS